MYRWKDRPSQTQGCWRWTWTPSIASSTTRNASREVSVVVVDYFMPEMDGVTFCRRLNNPSIGKILLTGRAEDSVAIEAFNFRRSSTASSAKASAGDGKARTGRRRTAATLLRARRRLRRRAWPVGQFSFLRDPAFRQVFESIVSTVQPVGSTRLLQSQGPAADRLSWGIGRFLLVLTEAELRAQFEIAEERGAPPELLKALGSGARLPWFWGGGYQPAAANPAPACIPPARCGEQWYYFSLIDRVDPFRLGHVKSRHLAA